MIVMNPTPELPDVGRVKNWRRMRTSTGRGTGQERTGRTTTIGGRFELTEDPGVVTGWGKEEAVLTSEAVVLAGEKATEASE